MAIVHVGIDLAKNVFAVHGVNEQGVATLRQPKVARGKLVELVAALPPSVVGMEACSGAHHWARPFQAHGLAVKLMAPKLVAPYRMSGKQGKNDAADAAAICEAMLSPLTVFRPLRFRRNQARRSELNGHLTRAQGWLDLAVDATARGLAGASLGAR